jgi:putative redox protein
MLTLLLAVAGCSAADVVVILEKMRVGLTHLAIEVEGVRRETDPRRYDALHIRYTMQGEALDAAKAERAVDLSIEKYCSVLHSLAPDIAISFDVELE